MEGFTYEYKGEEYPVFGMDLDHARKNAVLEAFIRYHENNPKIGMQVAQGTDYVSQDKFQKRADTLINYIQDDVEFFDPESQPVLEVIKEAYFSTKEIEVEEVDKDKEEEKEEPFFKEGRDRKYYLNRFQRLPETIRESRRCAGLLTDEDCDVAIAAYSKDPLIILGYPKIKYKFLKFNYCNIDNIPYLSKEYRKTRKFHDEKVVSIGGIRSVWAKRTNRSSGYQAQAYCAAILEAVDNYDYYLAEYANPDRDITRDE